MVKERESARESLRELVAEVGDCWTARVREGKPLTGH